MSIHSKLYYWVVCDHPGCHARKPDGDYDIDAWSDRAQAIQDAQESGWTVTMAGEFFCEDHGVTDEDPLEVPTEPEEAAP